MGTGQPPVDPQAPRPEEPTPPSKARDDATKPEATKPPTPPRPPAPKPPEAKKPDEKKPAQKTGPGAGARASDAARAAANLLGMLGRSGLTGGAGAASLAAGAAGAAGPAPAAPPGQTPGAPAPTTPAPAPAAATPSPAPSPDAKAGAKPPPKALPKTLAQRKEEEEKRKKEEEERKKREAAKEKDKDKPAAAEGLKDVRGPRDAGAQSTSDFIGQPSGLGGAPGAAGGAVSGAAAGAEAAGGGLSAMDLAAGVGGAGAGLAGALVGQPRGRDRTRLVIQTGGQPAGAAAPAPGYVPPAGHAPAPSYALTPSEEKALIRAIQSSTHPPLSEAAARQAIREATVGGKLDPALLKTALDKQAALYGSVVDHHALILNIRKEAALLGPGGSNLAKVADGLAALKPTGKLSAAEEKGLVRAIQGATHPPLPEHLALQAIREATVDGKIDPAKLDAAVARLAAENGSTYDRQKLIAGIQAEAKALAPHGQNLAALGDGLAKLPPPNALSPAEHNALVNAVQNSTHPPLPRDVAERIVRDATLPDGSIDAKKLRDLTAQAAHKHGATFDQQKLADNIRKEGAALHPPSANLAKLGDDVAHLPPMKPTPAEEAALIKAIQDSTHPPLPEDAAREVVRDAYAAGNPPPDAGQLQASLAAAAAANGSKVDFVKLAQEIGKAAKDLPGLAKLAADLAKNLGLGKKLAIAAGALGLAGLAALAVKKLVKPAAPKRAGAAADAIKKAADAALERSHLARAVCKIEVEGKELDIESSAIVSCVVDQSVDLVDRFRLTLTDNDLHWSQAPDFQVGKKITIKMGWHGESLPKLIYAQVTGRDVQFPRRGPVLLSIHGLSLDVKLNRGRFARGFYDVKDSDVAKRVIQMDPSLGLKPGTIDDSGVKFDYVFQSNQTNLEFLRQRARRYGFEVEVAPAPDSPSGPFDVLHFRKPPHQRTTATLLTRGRALKNFRARANLASQVKEVEVRGWSDVQKKEVTASVSTDADIWDKFKTQKLGRKLFEDFLGNVAMSTLDPDRTVQVVTSYPLRDPGTAKALAKAVLNSFANGFVTGDGSTVGNPDVRAGGKVNIQAVGQRFNGLYYVESASHVYEGQGYTTLFTVYRPGIITEPMKLKKWKVRIPFGFIPILKQKTFFEFMAEGLKKVKMANAPARILEPEEKEWKDQALDANGKIRKPDVDPGLYAVQLKQVYNAGWRVESEVKVEAHADEGAAAKLETAARKASGQADLEAVKGAGPAAGGAGAAAAHALAMGKTGADVDKGALLGHLGAGDAAAAAVIRPLGPGVAPVGPVGAGPGHAAAPAAPGLLGALPLPGLPNLGIAGGPEAAKGLFQKPTHPAVVEPPKLTLALEGPKGSPPAGENPFEVHVTLKNDGKGPANDAQIRIAIVRKGGDIELVPGGGATSLGKQGVVLTRTVKPGATERAALSFKGVTPGDVELSGEAIVGGKPLAHAAPVAIKVGAPPKPTIEIDLVAPKAEPEAGEPFEVEVRAKNASKGTAHDVDLRLTLGGAAELEFLGGGGAHAEGQTVVARRSLVEGRPEHIVLKLQAKQAKPAHLSLEATTKDGTVGKPAKVEKQVKVKPAKPDIEDVKVGYRGA